MNLPPVGTRYTRPGEPHDVVITEVTETTISYERGPHSCTNPHAEFLELLKATIAKNLELNTDDEI